MIATVFQYAGDTSLLTEELKAVGIGHTGASQYSVLDQHLVRPDVAGLVIGDSVTDVPVDSFDLLSLT